MIRKSGHRFSEKIMLKKKIERDDDSKKSHSALAVGRILPRARAVPALAWTSQTLVADLRDGARDLGFRRFGHFNDRQAGARADKAEHGQRVLQGSRALPGKRGVQRR